MEEKAQQLSQILSAQKSKTRENTNRVMEFVSGIETHGQQFKKSREKTEQLVDELQALVAMVEEQVEQLKVQEKGAEKLAKRWRTSLREY
jgi:hypothetical protein